MNKERKGSTEPRISIENRISGTSTPKSHQTWAQSVMNPIQIYRPTKSNDSYKIGSNVPLNQNVVGDEISAVPTYPGLQNSPTSFEPYRLPDTQSSLTGSRYTMLSGIPSLDHTPRLSKNDSHREPENIPTPRPSRIFNRRPKSMGVARVAVGDSLEGDFNENQHQENRGKRWSSEEDMYLLQQVSFLSHLDIGRHLRRSENAVVSRLKKLAFHMMQNGEDPDVVQTNLHLKDEDIQQISNECFIYTKKANGKFITTTKKPIKKGYFTPEQPQEIQLLLEIRTMLRKLLHLSHEKEGSNRSPKRDIIGMDRRQAAIRISDLNIEDLEKRSEEFAKTNI